MKTIEQLKNELNQVDEKGMKHGVWADYTSEGRLFALYTYEHGELHGDYVRFWAMDDKKPKKMEEGQFVDGYLHGEVTCYQYNGKTIQDWEKWEHGRKIW